MPTHYTLNETNALLKAISRAQEQLICQSEPRELFDGLLSDLLALTKSAFGFIGEVLHQADGQPYLKIHAITNIAWNEETRAFYEKNAPDGMEFHHLQTLFGAVMTTGEPVIANDPRNDPRRGGTPEGHPDLNAFLGLPVYFGKTLVGMIGVANRPGGYDQLMVDFLQPLLKTYGQITQAFNVEQHRKRTDAALLESLHWSKLLEKYISLTSGLSLKAIIKTTLTFLKEHLDIAYSSVAVIEADQAGFRVYSLHRDDNSWDNVGEYFSADTTVWSKIVQQKKPQYRPNIAAAASGKECDRELVERGLLSDMIVPMWIGNNCLGTLNITSERVDGFTEQNRHFIPLLAPSLTQAIYNAGLFNTLLEERNKLKAVVDERKKVRRALRDSQEQFRAIFEQATDSIFLVDPESGEIVAFNEKAHKRLGYTRKEFSSRNICDLNVEATEAEIKRRMNTVLEKGKGLFEEKFRTRGGKDQDVRIKSSRIMIQKKPFLLSVVEDISGLKKAEAFQRLSTTVFENVTEAILVTDADQKIISVNRAFTRITGYSNEEILGQTPWVLQSGKQDKAFYQAMWRSLTSIGHWQGEIWDRKKDGTLFLSWLSITAVKDAAGKTVQYASFYTDITERKRLEDQLHQAQKLETIGQLAGGVAHEFNNLLTPIIGHLEILSEQTTQQPQVQESIRSAKTAARRAAVLTKALLSFGRKTSMILRPQSLSALAEEVVQLLRQTIDRQIEINVQSPDDLWPVLIDADQIHQVIMNLCVNARDALMGPMADGEGFQPSILIKMENVHLDEAYCKAQIGAKVGDFVCLSVTDNGEGIDEAHMPRLFEPFFTTKPVGRGTGLGLASSHGIVKGHMGWIGAQTAKGEGTTFRVYLPRTKQSVVPAAQEVDEPHEAHQTATIMIVDDDELVRALGTAVLERLGYTVLCAEGGNEALEIFRKERGRIEIVILDLTMPSESGWEVLRRLRTLDPALKVIVSSGHDISSHAEAKGDLGTFTVLSKPFTSRDMERTVRAVFHQGKSP